MLLRCCFIHISIITVRLFLYLLYLCSWLDLGIYIISMWCIFLFSSSFLLIYCISSWIWTFIHINLMNMHVLDFFNNFSLALLIKELLIKKAYIRIGNLDLHKCRHCKNKVMANLSIIKVRKIDCLCCKEVNAMLIASAKIP